MSDGKKFVKTDSNLTPEQRLEELERKYSVIQERIQTYNHVLVEFGNISSDLNAIKRSFLEMKKSISDSFELNNVDISNIRARISELCQLSAKDHNSINEQAVLHKQTDDLLKTTSKANQHDIDVLHANVAINAREQAKTAQSLYSLDKSLSDLNKFVLHQGQRLDNLSANHVDLKTKHENLRTDYQAKIDQLMSSFQEMPEFNEWATKIYIKVCNEINDKQKAFYLELDKRSQQLKEQLASDPYTAESVKRILKNEMDTMALDGKNAYLKAANAAQQIQLLEKKVENINLILKKYELNK